MKTKTKIIIIAAAVILAVLGAGVALGISLSSSGAESRSVMQYTSLNLTFEKGEKDDYACEVKDNGGEYITVDANNEGGYYWCMVMANKPTPKGSAVRITLYRLDGGKKTVSKEYKITVKPFEKVKMSDVEINVGTMKAVKVKTLYESEYSLEYDKSVMNIPQTFYGDGTATFSIEGIKKGTTEVRAYINGTHDLAGSFKVTVGDFAAGIKKDFSTVTLSYNSHANPRFMTDGSFNLAQAIDNYHADGVYTAEPENKKLFEVESVEKTDTEPAAQIFYPLQANETKLTVYEQRGKAKKTAVGTVTLRVKQAKDSAVFESNMSLDNDGLFYENYITPGDRFDLKAAVDRMYINSIYSGSQFDESEYEFKASSNKPDIISVDENGVCTCHALDKEGQNVITYTVSFADGSEVTCKGSFDVVSAEDDAF